MEKLSGESSEKQNIEMENTGKIKVVQFIHGMNMGGAETLVKDYLLNIDKDKFDVTLLCYQRYNSPYDDIIAKAGIKTIYMCDDILTWRKKGIIPKIVNHYAIYFLTRKYIHELMPDVIHVHLSLNRYIKFAKPKKNTHIVYTQHFNLQRLIDIYKRDLKCLRWIIKKYFSDIIALDDEMKNKMIQICGTNAVYVLNNGIDISKYQKPIDVIKKRKELGVSKDAFIIVHIGRFSEEKNHDFIVDVFEKIKEKRTEAFLICVGRGETENKIRRKLESKKLMDCVAILHDRIDIDEILKASNIAIFPSLSEGIPLSIIEMQAAGLPIIASSEVSETTKISNIIRYIDLKESAEKWAETLMETADNDLTVRYDEIEKWDIRYIVKQLEEIYLKGVF